MGCGASTNSNNPSDSYISQPEPPTRYLRKQLLGKGTYGKVYKCIDQTDNTQYAMKVVKVDSATKQEALKQIQQLKSEISMLKKLNHPGIVKYQSFDVTTDLEQVEIVMELVHNGTLKEYIDKNGPLPEKVTAQICAKILETLVYLHSQNIIHRDLKCANVLLTENLIPKLSDFGTAKIIPAQDRDDIAKLSASLKGTPYYMAPEVLKRTGHNHAADIWSFGCMVIEMLSGKTPWAAHSAKFSEIIGYISSGIHPPFPSNISKECSFFLESCLDPIPSQRLEAKQLLKHRFIQRISPNGGPMGRTNYHQDKTNSQSRSEAKPKSRTTIYDLNGFEIEDIEDDEGSYHSPSISRQMNSYSSRQDPFEYKTQSKSQNRKPSGKKPVKKHTTKILHQINQLDRLESEINEVSVEEEDIIKDRFYVKKTLANLKKSRQGKNTSKTATTVKNTQENLLSMENSRAECYPIRSNTEMSCEEQAINTMISRAQRNQYLQQKKLFLKQKEQQKKKWEQELREGAEMLKKQFSSRYTIPKV